VKVRIGVSAGPGPLDSASLGALGDDLVELGFDSLWLPEVLTTPSPDPLIALAWAAAHNPSLKIGTTMLLPGRHPLRLAKQVAVLDALSEGRFLVTFVPGLARGPERRAVGVDPARRGEAMEELLPLVRRLWSGEPVTSSGPTWELHEFTLAPLPVQEPFEFWLGGMARSSLLRCGRLADGWLPSMCTPTEGSAGREVIEEAAAQAGRTISPEHFGVSIGYATSPLDDRLREALSANAKGRPLGALVPTGLPQLAELLGRFIEQGFSKFVVRPIVSPEHWRKELEALAEAVGGLQT
jgi:probable F420-dependent oxidoreductase